MGKIKSFLKKKYSAYKKSSKEQAEYNAKLRQRVREARREAYADEGVKQARINAKLKARRVFNPAPKPQGQGFGGSMTPQARQILYGNIGMTPQSSTKTVRIKQEIKKKRKKSKKKYKFITKQVPNVNKSQTELNKLLYGS